MRIHWFRFRSTCRPAILSIALVATLTGCASLDPRPDIGRAAELVAARSGTTPQWTERWESSLSFWDGHSPLRVEQAVVMALRNNREIRAEVEQIGTSRADLVQAGLLPNPVLGLTLRFPFDPISGGTFVGAQAVQSFTALWLRGGRILAADARLNQTVLDVSDKSLRLVAEVRAAHVRIVFGQRLLSLSDENLATIRRSVESLDNRVRGGEGTPLDVNRARQQLAKAEAEHSRIARDVAKERRGLLELIGFASEGADWAVDEQVSLSFTREIDEPTAIVRASQQRLDVAAARAVVEAQRAELSLEERSRLGDIGLGIDFERSQESGAKSVGPVVELSIPIFDTNQAQIAKAGSRARAAFATYEAIVHRAIREARVAWVDLSTSSALTEQYRAGVLPIAERNLKLAESALKAGQSDVTVLLESQREVIEARRTLIELEREAALAQIALDRAIGGVSNPSPTPSAQLDKSVP